MMKSFIVLLLASFSSLAQVPETASKDYKSFRDPFKPMIVEEDAEFDAQSDLEKASLGDIEVLGVMTGPKKARAMLKVKNKDKTYLVTKGDKIGEREGQIILVTTKSITVREKVINPLGETETLDTEIKMKDNKK